MWTNLLAPLLTILRVCLVGVWEVLFFLNICGSNGKFCARKIQEGVVKRTLTNRWAEMHYWLDVIRATNGPNSGGLKHTDIFCMTEQYEKYGTLSSVVFIWH
jgi:hypothetical protein